MLGAAATVLVKVGVIVTFAFFSFTLSFLGVTVFFLGFSKTTQTLTNNYFKLSATESISGHNISQKYDNITHIFSLQKKLL